MNSYEAYVKGCQIESAMNVSREKGLSGVKLPQITIPTFDGKILTWKSFWGQFDATIYSKTGLNDTIKLMYLQDALKDGPANYVIQGSH